MADGPNHELNFQNGILTTPSNLVEITRYLRFFKGTDSYQEYLRVYLPQLAKPEYEEEFAEFVKDYKNKEKAAELKDALKALKKPTKAELDAEKKEKEEADAKAKKEAEDKAKEEAAKKAEQSNKK